MPENFNLLKQIVCCAICWLMLIGSGFVMLDGVCDGIPGCESVAWMFDHA